MRTEEQIKEYRKEYYQRPEIKTKQKEYYQRPEVKARTKERMKQRIDKINDWRRNYLNNKLNTDYSYKIIKNARQRLRNAFKLYSTTGKMSSAGKYGINWKAIIEHLKPFPENIKDYEIDHIIPLSRFDFNNLEHIKIAFAPENHQWLTIQENLEKGNRLVIPHHNH